MAKIRSGFVSNSSSSSFLIYFKGNKKELQKELENVFRLPKDYPIKNLEKEISKVLVNNCDVEEFESFIEDQRIDAEEEIELLTNRVKEGFKIYAGCVADDSGDAIETMLCNMNFDFASENLIIEHVGGY